ncbi:FIG003492: Threonine dehydrogenase and related Zn-dependent dehydrogenases [hydrothermal vent metagenome]|uniref:FIG003492: Threonine dehydrogenase and related Zn-dependent dehydrogenases n=1 Tax=hydrothermal vent metagenome TaxID=652676 RepID=A0A3B0T9J2_9ZZZZ
MDWKLALYPSLPLWALGLAVLAAVAVIGVAVFVRSRGAGWRALVFAILIFALAGPRLINEERDTLTDVVAVIVDRSPSQTLGARTGRTDEALEKLRQGLDGWPNLEVRIREAGNKGDGETRLFGALDNTLADVPPERLAGVIILTDGQVHDVPGVSGGFDGKAPVHVLLTGARAETDRRLTVQNAPRYGIVDTTQTVVFTVKDVTGAGKLISTGEPVTVTLRIDGEEAATRTVTVGEEASMAFTLSHGGNNIVELEAAPLGGEITAANNRAVFSTTGIRDRLRVLLVSGEPHAGERTWRNLLKADGAVDLVHFTILRPPEKQDGTPINELSLIAFPTRELFSLKLAEFDLVIFDRYQRRGVLPMIYLDNVVEYVRAGGAVLTASGPSFAGATSIFRSPLGNILPAAPTGVIIEEPFRVAINTTGRRHPVTRGLPGAGATIADTPSWGRWFRLIDAEVGRGDIVMEGPDGKPLMVLAREGEGRVAQLLSDQAWLWARGYEGGGPQAELLRRLAHWLMKEPELEEERLGAEPASGRIAITRYTVKDAVGEVTVTAPGGTKMSVTLTETRPGEWTATLPAEEQGFYRLAGDDLSALVAVGSIGSAELADIVTTPDKLAPLAKATDGGVFWLAANTGAALDMPRLRPVREGRSASGQDWLGLRRRDAYTVRGLIEIPLMTGLLAASLLLGLLGWTWYREGR